MPASRRCIFLAGAPEATSLVWDEKHLFVDFDIPLIRFLEGQPGVNNQSTHTPTPTAHFAKWRFLERSDPDICRFSMADADVEATQFLQFDDSDKHSAANDEHLGFLEYSLALLNDVDTSQILPGVINHNAAAATTGQQTSFLTNTSFATTSFTETSFRTTNGSFIIDSPAKIGIPGNQINISAHLTDLKRIPNAEYITRISPQTITVNILVGVISISPARTVRLRKRNAEMDIIELSVGDDTRAGFSISFWLTPIESQQRKPVDEFRATLRHLRAGDVVLLQNVALSCFNGCVYGQSLSKRFARNSTSISVLGEGCGHDWPAPLVSKYTRVQQWANDFVGAARPRALTPSSTWDRAAKRRKVDELPPDTQD